MTMQPSDFSGAPGHSANHGLGWPNSPLAEQLRSWLLETGNKQKGNASRIVRLVQVVRKAWQEVLTRRGQQPSLHMSTSPHADIKDEVHEWLEHAYADRLEKALADTFGCNVPMVASEMLDAIWHEMATRGGIGDHEIEVALRCLFEPQQPAMLSYPMPSVYNDELLSDNAQNWILKDHGSGLTARLDAAANAIVFSAPVSVAAMESYWSPRVQAAIRVATDMLTAMSGHARMKGRIVAAYSNDADELLQALSESAVWSRRFINASIWNKLECRNLVSDLLQITIWGDSKIAKGLEEQLSVALSLLAAAESQPDDRIVLVLSCAAVESLLCKSDFVSADFARRCTALLQADLTLRPSVVKTIKKSVYGARSDVAHGNSRKQDYGLRAEDARKLERFQSPCSV